MNRRSSTAQGNAAPRCDREAGARSGVSNTTMKNTLIESHSSLAHGLLAKVWLTVNGRWTVTYHDTDSGEQIGAFTICDTLKQARAKAKAFAVS